MKFVCIERPLSRLFFRYGAFIADYPYWFLLVPLVVTSCLLPGFYYFNQSGDVESLYTPLNAPSLRERDVVSSLFPYDASSHYDPLRSTAFITRGIVIVTSATDGGDVLSPSNQAAIRRLDATIRNMTTQHDGKTSRYADICARTAGACWNDGVLSLPPHDLHFPTHTVDGRAISLVDSVAGVSLSPSGVVRTAEAWQLIYPLDPRNAASIAWQKSFLTLVESASLPGLRLARYTAYTVRDELERNTQTTMPLFAITFAVLTTFGVLTCWSTDGVAAKPSLGVLGVVSALVAVVTAFGLLMFVGVDFIDIVAIGPFLVVGNVQFAVT